MTKMVKDMSKAKYVRSVGALLEAISLKKGSKSVLKVRFLDEGRRRLGYVTFQGHRAGFSIKIFDHDFNLIKAVVEVPDSRLSAARWVHWFLSKNNMKAIGRGNTRTIKKKKKTSVLRSLR